MIKNLFLSLAPVAALGTVTVLLAPAKDSFGFSKIGGLLNVDSQRDYRVFNNFIDSTANNNLAEDPNYPGWYGADRALWKAAAEWGSLPFGGGAGDPNQANLGDGGGNFDFFFAGRATAPGNSNHNIASAVNSCGGGTLAYVQSPISNGWRMRFCENRTWSDGPSGPGGGRFDLQGVGCHEFGHALGLGHTNVNGSTMVGSTPNGMNQRSLGPDDIAGLHCIYGAAHSTKPIVTSVQYNPFIDEVTIDGTGFDDTENEVWFTRRFATATGFAQPIVKVTGIASTNGGTQIVITPPFEAGTGEVAVRAAPLGGGRGLSNPWPLDLMRGGGARQLAVSTLTPGTVEALDPGTTQSVTITGTSFDDTIVVTLNGVLLSNQSYTVVDDTTITLDMPQVTTLGTQTISIQKDQELVSADLDVVEAADPTLQVGNGDPLNPVAGSVDLLIAGPVGETEVVLYSFSDAPSSFPPYVNLDLGSDFTDLFLLELYTVPSTGWTQETFPLQSTTLDLYLQAVTLARGIPIPVSNLQSISILP